MTFAAGYLTSLFFGTFILEDVALATGVVLLSEGKIGFSGAFLACFLGISLGDLGLYFFGYGVSRFEFAKRFPILKKYQAVFSSLRSDEFLTYPIVISRVIPGTRLPTYLGAGFLRYSFFKFLILTITSVAAWVFIVLSGGKSIQGVLASHWIITIILFYVVLSIIRSILPRLADPWGRRAFLHSWRKWTHFEFWPSWFFYIPIVPVYIYRSIVGRSLLLPFYANPQILNGGLLGESKWDFLKHLKADDSTTLKSILVNEDLSVQDAQNLIQESGFDFPFILKPDVGQRGYGVRIIKSEAALADYLVSSRGCTLIAQTLSRLPNEAGLFYYRKPSDTRGTIFSITDKTFPFLIGDGKKTVGDLILSDPRARIIAPTYFARHKNSLNEVLPKGFIFYLSECGNHCQGAIFKNGHTLGTSALLDRLETIARNIPDFYFGRFDVRYADQENLKDGFDFEIVEVNGAGSEATHIWDPETRLLEAYHVLFAQWKILFEIGLEIKRQKRKHSNIELWRFLKESFRVMRRNNSLSVSS